jgi:serine/threonine-protein kinase
MHRDVKPSNILVTEDDFAYLIDFGIARATDATKLTSTGATVGTLAYMAPERFTSDREDARADIYALTCVLHECLTGSQPFPGDSLERQITSHLTLPPPRPSTMQPGISPQMDEVIATGMAKNPDQRYATTKDLATAARAALTAPIPHTQPAPFVPPPPAPGWSAPVPYPNTGPSAPPAHAATQYGAPAPPPAWSPTAMPNAQKAQPPSPWWHNPAVWVLAALVTVVVIVAAVVVVIVWPDGSSDAHPVTSTQPSQQRLPSTSSTKPSTPPTNSTTMGPTPSASTTAGPTQLHTADGLSGLLVTMRSRFGDTMGFQLLVYPAYAVTERVSPTNSHVEQDFMYRDGQWNSWGADTTTSSFDVLADLSAFNADAVAATLASAPQSLGAPDGSQTYLIVEGAEGGGLELSIHSAAPGTGFMEVNPDGSVKEIHPP